MVRNKHFTENMASWAAGVWTPAHVLDRGGFEAVAEVVAGDNASNTRPALLSRPSRSLRGGFAAIIATVAGDNDP